MNKLKWIGMCFVFFIGMLITAVNLKWDLGIFNAVGKIPYGDKICHFFLIGGLTFFVNILMNLRRVLLYRNHYLVGSICVFLFISIEECSQGLLAHRNFEIIDMLCNYMGIFVFGELAIKVSDRNNQMGTAV